MSSHDFLSIIKSAESKTGVWHSKEMSRCAEFAYEYGICHVTLDAKSAGWMKNRRKCSARAMLKEFAYAHGFVATVASVIGPRNIIRFE